MTYEEFANKLKTDGRVKSSECTGEWFFMLIHDRIIKTIQYNGKLYEVNFIPLEYSLASLIIINEENCKTYHNAEERIVDIIKNINLGNRVSISLQDEYFEVIIEVLEADE